MKLSKETLQKRLDHVYDVIVVGVGQGSFRRTLSPALFALQSCRGKGRGRSFGCKNYVTI